MRICITDATYKHAIALAKYLRLYDPSLKLVGVSPYKPAWQWPYQKRYDDFLTGNLSAILQHHTFDLVIPVGNASVDAMSQLPSHRSILPSRPSVEIGLSKSKTLAIADTLGIPIPKTFYLKELAELSLLDVPFPCVVKGALEAGKNVVSYPQNRDELLAAVSHALHDPTQQNTMPIVQEYVAGTGLGFFAYYQKGTLKRFYMHQRIREFPLSGGASTAAKTIFHQEAFDYGKALLDHLEWNGPAMVEFKYNPATGRLALMEINPKFWGSTELGLAAGVNFGELLVRTARGEEIVQDLSPDSYKKITFYWPLEGDLKAISQSGQWGSLKDYVCGGYSTNLGTNGFPLNALLLAKGVLK